MVKSPGSPDSGGGPGRHAKSARPAVMYAPGPTPPRDQHRVGEPPRSPRSRWNWASSPDCTQSSPDEPLPRSTAAAERGLHAYAVGKSSPPPRRQCGIAVAVSAARRASRDAQGVHADHDASSFFATAGLATGSLLAQRAPYLRVECHVTIMSSCRRTSDGDPTRQGSTGRRRRSARSSLGVPEKAGEPPHPQRERLRPPDGRSE